MSFLICCNAIPHVPDFCVSVKYHLRRRFDLAKFAAEELIAAAPENYLFHLQYAEVCCFTAQCVFVVHWVIRAFDACAFCLVCVCV
jgi:hypothetical protein